MKTLNKIKFLVILIVFLCKPGFEAFAQTQTIISAPVPEIQTSILKKIGINYFVFFNGPGLDPASRDFQPNQFGLASDRGLNTFNLFSVKYRLTENLSLDMQTRFNTFFNRRDALSPDQFSSFRWESPRIGISGKLAKGEDWSLSGAVNTDFPYFMPSPLTGYTSVQRKVAFNPGMFANFSFTPKNSRWTLNALLTPRFFFYADENALEPEMRSAAFSAQNKPHLVLQLSPTLNYQLNSKTQITSMITLDYRKQLVSGWNPLEASTLTNGSGNSWRLHPLTLALGLTREFSKSLKVFPYFETFPIAGQRINARTGRMASFAETARFGMWVSGVVF